MPQSLPPMSSSSSQTSPQRVIARRVATHKVVHAEVFTLGRRRAFMEQLEARRDGSSSLVPAKRAKRAS